VSFKLEKCALILWKSAIGIMDENGNLTMKIIIPPLPLAGEGWGEGGTTKIGGTQGG